MLCLHLFATLAVVASVSIKRECTGEREVDAPIVLLSPILRPLPFASPFFSLAGAAWLTQEPSSKSISDAEAGEG